MIRMVDDLVPGDVITGRVFDVGTDDESVKRGKPSPVRKITACVHQWRTHVHINDRDCWDGRAWVETQN